MTEGDAHRRTLLRNGRRAGTDCDRWTVAVEIGKPQGTEGRFLELFPGDSPGMLVSEVYRPVRIARPRAV